MSRNRAAAPQTGLQSKTPAQKEKNYLKDFYKTQFKSDAGEESLTKNLLALYNSLLSIIIQSQIVLNYKKCNTC